MGVTCVLYDKLCFYKRADRAMYVTMNKNNIV